MAAVIDRPIEPRPVEGVVPVDAPVCMNYACIIKQQLHSALSRIASTGSFTTFNPCLNAPNPGLFVKDIGFISLPLLERDAHSIIQASLQSFGKDFALASARMIKELDPERFELRNPAWQQTLQDIVNSVALDTAAGMSTVKAEPYKLLLYQRAARSKPQEQYVVGWPKPRPCDPEKRPPVFGTLEICLPSKHEGGELYITREGQTKILDSSKSSGFGYSFMAWYNTVTHEVKPVTSGYRLTLIYNLTYNLSPGTLQRMAMFDSEKESLQRVFALWNAALGKASPKKLVYTLDQKYPNTNLSVNCLMGNDRLRVLCLQEVCAEANFQVYLGNLERTVRGGGDEDEDDAYGYGNGFGGRAYFGDGLRSEGQDDSTYVFHEITNISAETTGLEQIVDLSGSETAANIHVGKCDVVQPEHFTNCPDSEDYSGLESGGRVTVTRYYRRTVVVLMPENYRTEFFFGLVRNGRLDVKPWIERLMWDARANPSNPRSKRDLTRLCQLVIEMNKAFLEKNYPGHFTKSEWESKYSQYSEGVIGGVVRASLLLERLDLFEEALAVVPQGLSPWVYVDIGKAIHALGFARVKNQLNKAARNLSRVYERYNALDDILFGYESVRPQGPCHMDWEDLEGWAKAKTQESLDHGIPVYRKDGSALVRIAKKYGNRFLFQRVLPFVKTNISNIPFAIAFVTKLFEASKDESIANDVVVYAFRDIVSDLIPELTLGFDSETARYQNTDRSTPVPANGALETIPYLDQSSLIPFVRKIDGQSIAQLLSHCISLNLDQEISGILRKLTAESRTAYPSAFHFTLLPFLSHLLTNVLPAHNIPLRDPRYQHFTQQLIATYTIRYVRLEPRNWVRPRYGCGCDDCEMLNRFLVDPKFDTVGFAMAKKRREHVESQVQDKEGLSAETVKLSTPHSLVVRKVQEDKSMGLAKWRERCVEAEEWIGSLGTIEQVKEVLGWRYEELASLKAVRMEKASVAWAVGPGRRIRYS
ncbi:MAG: hypothetical protein M1839_001439 [Geoglossum umbratile]|nr:MAG: hypothetical protein M1839_001439 [Geoglossum umbratile]